MLDSYVYGTLAFIALVILLIFLFARLMKRR